jgi:glycine cleavage system transcriptional repressor
MHRNIVLTLTGPDRIGVVERLTGLLLERGGNVETSRMARLGGEFAVLMLVTIPSSKLGELGRSLDTLAVEGYKITTAEAASTYAEGHAGWLAYRIEVEGADHEGIIHEVARYLSRRGINIETMDSECAPASTSGVPLFSMTAEVVAPPGLDEQSWRAGLDEIGRRLNLEIRAEASGDRP